MMVESSQAGPSIPDAERRHLTVLFCDVVGSTELSGKLDPEDLLDVMSAYRQSCGEVVRHYDGHVAQLLGDGLLVYFSLPSHEDDARRAIRAGLAMVDAVSMLNARLERDKNIQLRIRVGIDTGRVVVGEKELAVGAPPYLASKLQHLAEPDTVVISEDTFREVEGYFTCTDLGARALEGAPNHAHAYQVLEESGADSRLETAGARGLTPFIGRELELRSLLDLWERAAGGLGQVVQVSGEAGIGKSRLVEVVREHITSDSVATSVSRCSAYHANSALYPVISRLERFLGLKQGDTPEEKLDKLEQSLQTYGFSLGEVMPLLATLFSLPLLDRYTASSLSPPEQRQRTLSVLVDWHRRAAERQPLLAVWEDLHWADPSTIEFLGLLIEQTPTTSLLTLLTFRPEFRPPWPTPSSLTELTLGRFGRPHVEEMIEKITGEKSLPDELTEQIIEKTDGVPLFVEELLKTILDSGFVRDEGGRYVLTGPSTTIAIPATLEDSLMARLDRLGTAKAVAQRGAILGREFSHELIQSVDDRESTQQGLAQLVEAGVLYYRGRLPQVTYVFKHALIQEAAYQSLLKRTREKYHRRTAEVLEAQFDQIAEKHPELVAHHYTQARCAEEALPYWQKAGERARERSANTEAIHHLHEGLKVLEALPDTPDRSRKELALYIALLGPLIAAKGYTAPETAKANARALELGESLGEVADLFPVLYGQWVYRLVRAEHQTARTLSEDFLRLATDRKESAPLLIGHRLRGFSLFSAGELTDAQADLKQSLELYEPEHHGTLKLQYGQDPRCACEAFMSLIRWLNGYPDEALRWSREALDHARDQQHSNTLGYVLCFGSATSEVFRRDVTAAEQHGRDLITFSEEQQLPVWLAYARVLHGWTLTENAEGEKGIARMTQGLADLEASGISFMLSFLLTLLADAYGKLGRTEDGLATLTSASSAVKTTGERFWEAEVYRLQGELLLALPGDHHAKADTCFHQALDVARRQRAKSLELRATMSLSRLWQRQEKYSEARQILREAYNWFTEGFDTEDLQQARPLLRELEAM